MAATSGLTLKTLGLEAPASGVVLGEIAPEDIAALVSADNSTSPPTPPQRLQKVRSIHHQAARLLASGMPPQQVSLAVGWSPNRVYLLKNDPAFQELVAFYQQREDELMIDVRSRLISLGLDAASELHERIIEKPEDVSSKVLLEAMQLSLDRAGHAPGRSNSGSSSLSGSELNLYTAAARAAEGGRVLEYVPNNRRAEVGEDLTDEPVAEASTVSGGQSQGSGV